MIPFIVIALVIQGTLSMSDYYFDEWDSQWEKARAEDLILVEGDPVIVGCVEYHMTEPTGERNRACIMRSYDISSQDTIWTFLYDGDTEIMDDDGYALLHYTVPTIPVQDRFLGAGFVRAYLGPDPVRLEDPAGLAVILDDHGETVCGLHEFRESDWVDICSRDAVYIGEYDEYDYSYAVCGWYYETDGQGEKVGPYGAVEIACGNQEIALIEDNSIESAWEQVIYDSENEVLILGGLEGIPGEDGSLDELQMAYIDLTSNSLEIEGMSIGITTSTHIMKVLSF